MAISVVFILIAIGATGFLIVIIIDYLKAKEILRPKADYVRNEILQSEIRIETEKSEAQEAKEDVKVLTDEIKVVKKELVNLEKELEELKTRERRRKPTKFKLED
jgi:septal ring factor EnvC (AmiA/AmiB activator)